MTCGGCEISVDEAIKATYIIDSVKSSFLEGKAFVCYGDDNVDMSQIEDAIRSVGYKPLLLKMLIAKTLKKFLTLPPEVRYLALTPSVLRP